MTALQKQLQADRKTLADDQARPASDQQIAVDQARVELGAAAISAAEAKSEQSDAATGKAGRGGLGETVDVYL